MRDGPAYAPRARIADDQLARRITRLARRRDFVPLLLFAEIGDAPAAHGTTHRPAGSDPIYAAQAYTPVNDSTLRTFDCATVTTADLAKVVATMLRDKASNKEPLA